ncbi:LysR substrate-binding domain-containing protein [Dactylosporangium maewongense]|uniref:LysR substrate-binding domain-containing protein n=1 Tax=Dactylosporangium maewongense TaxID=634393 RepID=A0ABN2DDQ9_9ACTN
MELRRLRLLDQLARLGTVAAVADALSYSPSSVSVQLAQLEQEAGAKLLRRVGRNLELTPAGRRLASYAADALAADEAVRAELATIGDTPGGRLRMTIVQTPALALLPATLARLAATNPDLQVEVHQRETAPALDELRSRAVDLVVGIEYDPVPVARQRDIDRRDLLREDVLLAVHPAHPLAARPPVALAACEDAAWATGHRGTGLDAVLRNVCNRLAGFEPRIQHRSDDGLVLGALVASQRAVALLPALLTAALPQIAAHPLREERLQRTIFTATRATAAGAPAVLAVQQALRASAAGIARDRPDIEALP